MVITLRADAMALLQRDFKLAMERFLKMPMSKKLRVFVCFTAKDCSSTIPKKAAATSIFRYPLRTESAATVATSSFKRSAAAHSETVVPVVMTSSTRRILAPPKGVFGREERVSKTRESVATIQLGLAYGLFDPLQEVMMGQLDPSRGASDDFAGQFV